MALNINNVILAGHFTRDPQVRFLANEQCVCNFGLAINRRFKGSDGELREEATFIDCEAWGRTAELIGKYLVKGSAAYVEGRLKLDTWEKDGQKHYKLKVVVETVQFIGPPKTQAGTPSQASAAPSAGEPAGAAGSTKPAGRPAPSVGDDEPPF
jgi:single-strand DNA-binding protein